MEAASWPSLCLPCCAEDVTEDLCTLGGCCFRTAALPPSYIPNPLFRVQAGLELMIVLNARIPGTPLHPVLFEGKLLLFSQIIHSYIHLPNNYLQSQVL